ncbi:MAG: DNA repair protein RecN [Anaerolineaceae bacterium]|nr:DNA repair protein RecN [Anaerolineaceae bacterium]
MLIELRIENFAIIQSLELEFGSGLVTFTGETGAGKSILLDAILAIIGGRVDNTFLRSGATKALVEGTFSIPTQNRNVIHAVLKREELLDEEEFITLGRELRQGGRTIARINGRAANVSLLKELGTFLVDIHGQSEHLSLLNVRSHQGLLDRYAECLEELQIYQKAFDEITQLKKELDSLKKMERDAVQQVEFLTFQIQEIEAARLQVGEDSELRNERDRLANAEHLGELVQQSLLILEDGSSEVPSVSDQIGQVSKSISSLIKIDGSKNSLMEQIDELIELAGEISRDLQDYLEMVEFNPRRLEIVETRLDLIHNLKRKYGGSVEAVLEFEDKAREKLENIAHAEERIESLQILESETEKKLLKAGLNLSIKRRRAVTELSQAIEHELDDLSMENARFTVDIQYKDEPSGIVLPEENRVISFSRNGFDQIEFMIAPNPGEGFKPLVKVASGGETSRLMLALKNVLVKADSVPTLIFDEIDQGIGGRIGMIVGEKLWQLGREHQVLCVTHLPQLAAFGDQHFKVGKQIVDGRTQTRVEKMVGQNRLEELAQMIGTVSETNRKAARESLELAEKRIQILQNKTN